MSYRSTDRPGPTEFKARLRECPTGCLEWMGTRNKLGYGTLHVNGGRAWLAHRWAWTLQRGAIPDGLLVLHSCDNPPCCNVNHLWLGTNADNKHDSMRKGRHAWTSFAGELHWKSKLTAAQALAIRSDVRVQRIIAADYGICQSHVSAIKNRKLWAGGHYQGNAAMSHRSTRRFLCDGCRVIESSEIELTDSEFGPMTAPGWLRVATMLQRGEAIEHSAMDYCPTCAPLIVSYLAGRKLADGEHA